MNSRDLRTHPAFVIVVVTIAQLATAMTNAVLPTIAPELARSLGVDPVLIGYQVSLLFAAAMVGTLYGGSFVSRFGPARTAQWCVGLCATGLAMFALPHIGFIALGSLVAGFGTGLVNPSAAQILVSYTPPHRRNLLFSIKQTGMPLAGVITSLTAPALALAFGWRWALAPVIATALVAFLLNQIPRAQWDADRNPDAAMGRQALDVVPMVWREPALRWVSVVGMCFSAIQRIFVTFAIVYLVSERGYGLVEAGVMLSAMQAAGFVSRPIWGWMADRVGSSLAVLMAIMIISIVGAIALIQVDNEWPRWAVYPVFAALGVSSLGWNGVLHAEAARLSPPGMAGAVAGGSTFFVFAGVLIGPSMFAVAYGFTGSYAATYPLAVVLGVLSMLLLYMARRAADARPATGASRPDAVAPGPSGGP